MRVLKSQELDLRWVYDENNKNDKNYDFIDGLVVYQMIDGLVVYQMIDS